MQTFIVISGILVVGAAVYLAWLKRGSGVWATFLAGIVLVLIGGPVGPRLQELSLSQKGLKVSYHFEDVKAADFPIQRQRVERNLLALVGAREVAADGGHGGRGDVEKKYVDYFYSLGYLPTELVGAGALRPGAIIEYKDGIPITWATQAEAFPGLRVESTASGFGDLAREDRGSRLAFRCRSGTAHSVSLSALQRAQNETIAAGLGHDKAQARYVITDALECGGWDVVIEIIEGRQRYRYASNDPVVIAYRLARVSIQP